MVSTPSRGDVPFPTTTAWQGAMRDLLERAIARHGGWAAWRRAAGASLVPVSLTGVVPVTKGVNRTFHLPGRIEVWPRDAVAIFHDYPTAGSRAGSPLARCSSSTRPAP